MGKKVRGGWCERQSDAVPSERGEGRAGGEGLEKNVRYQEADNTAKWRVTSGFPSKSFPGKVTHTSAGTQSDERTVKPFSWSGFSGRFAAGEITTALGNGDSHIPAKAGRGSSRAFGWGHSVFAVPPFLK